MSLVSLLGLEEVVSFNYLGYTTRQQERRLINTLSESMSHPREEHKSAMTTARILDQGFMFLDRGNLESTGAKTCRDI